MNINNKGFSLVELIVVTAIFVAVIAISSDAFLVIQRNVSTQSRLAQSNIDGVIGLEILRSDLEAAGYGLFWSSPDTSTTFTFVEADDISPQNAYNLTTGIPFAVQSGDNVVLNDATQQINGTDYLVLRGMTLPHNLTSQRWSYMTRQMTFATMSSATPITPFPKRIKNWANNNFTSDDRVIVVTGTEDKDPANHRKLVTNGSVFFTQFSDANLDPFQPAPPTMPPVPHALSIDSPASFIYGVNGENNLRMPYNRADYYVRVPNAGFSRVPQRCAPNTGILFKAVVGHESGTQTEFPLLDCVADFQIVYSLDRNNNGNPEDVPASGLRNLDNTPMSAAEIRNQLKNIQIYILTHEGKKDTSFTYPNNTIGVGPGTGLTSGSGRTFGLYSSSQKNYRWKVYRITVSPKNLLRAQK
jgi:prepilin-type N-terminal cleavage/methylation domain-containing protein